MKNMFLILAIIVMTGCQTLTVQPVLGKQVIVNHTPYHLQIEGVGQSIPPNGTAILDPKNQALTIRATSSMHLEGCVALEGHQIGRPLVRIVLPGTCLVVHSHDF